MAIAPTTSASATGLTAANVTPSSPYTANGGLVPGGTPVTPGTGLIPSVSMPTTGPIAVMDPAGPVPTGIGSIQNNPNILQTPTNSPILETPANYPISSSGPIEGPPPTIAGPYPTTSLNNQNQQNFQNWMNNNPQTAKTPDIDMQGAWLNKFPQGWQQQYAQPTHPAFSDQSIYHGQNGWQGGSWTNDNAGKPVGFTPSQQNINNAGGWQGLQQHFANNYPGTLLTPPSGGQSGKQPAGAMALA